LAKFNTFSRSGKPISKFNTVSIPRGNPACHLILWGMQSHIETWHRLYDRNSLSTWSSYITILDIVDRLLQSKLMIQVLRVCDFTVACSRCNRITL